MSRSNAFARLVLSPLPARSEFPDFLWFGCDCDDFDRGATGGKFVMKRSVLAGILLCQLWLLAGTNPAPGQAPPPRQAPAMPVAAPSVDIGVSPMCADCACCVPCKKHCVEVPDTKVVKKTCYDCKCEDFCKSRCCICAYLKKLCGCDLACCGKVGTRHILLKKVISKEHPSCKCVVEPGPCPAVAGK